MSNINYMNDLLDDGLDLVTDASNTFKVEMGMEPYSNIIVALRTGGPYSLKMLSDMTGIAPEETIENVQEMEELGILENKNHEYVLTELAKELFESDEKAK